jgi:hypothetical protein
VSTDGEAPETEPPTPEPSAAPSVSQGSRVALAPPSGDEVAAILAAIEVAWPKPVAAAPANDKPSRWRFSGRWWSAPIPMRRVRPW